MRPVYTRAALLAFVVALLLGLAAPARAEVTTNEIVPFNRLQFFACLNGGAGDDLSLSGRLHILTTTTVDKNGGVHTKTTVHVLGVSGTGSSGEEYVGVGLTNQSASNSRGPYPTHEMYTETFSIIGKGTAGSVLVHIVAQLTIDANGVTRVDFLNFDVACS